MLFNDDYISLFSTKYEYATVRHLAYDILGIMIVNETNYLQAYNILKSYKKKLDLAYQE